MVKVKKILKSIFKSKRIALVFVLFLTIGLFVVGNQVQATGPGEAVAIILGWILYPFIFIITKLIVLLFYLLTGIFQYNDFINAAPVVAGWVIVRDLCNMFFILILLVIAFATILRVEGYDVKKMIPKLIIMAVLINFSKTICGLILDAANLVMNTFVNSFKDMVGGNLTTMLGLPNLLSSSEMQSVGKTPDATMINVAGSLILALIFSLIALVVTVVLLAVLVVRMVMIWIYIVLSPLAYLLSSFPQGKKYASQWWDDFTKNVITGPILAFFIWLAFISAQDPATKTMTGALSKGAASATDLANGANLTEPVVGISSFGTPDTMLKFIISIGMLMGGLIIAQQAGGAIGKIAGAGMAKIQAGGNFLKKKTADVGKRAAVGAGHVALAGGKMIDRLPALAMGNSKAGRAVAQHGLIGGALKTGMAATGNLKAYFGRKIDQNYDVNKARVSAIGPDGKLKETIKHGDFDYKLNSKNVYQRYDKDKKDFVGKDGEIVKDGDDAYTLKKKKFNGEEKAVGAINPAMANIHTAIWSAGSVARAARFEAEDKRVEDEKKKIIRFDDTQLHSLLNSITSSKTQKRAAAEQLAERGKFNDLAEINKARSLYGTNGKALGDFNEKVNIKQAHKAYDFTSDKDVERFHGDIAKGKVDMVKFDLDELAKPAAFKAFESFYGDDTPDQLKKIGNRASSKKDKEKVSKVFETATQLHINGSAESAKMAADLTAAKDTVGAEQATKKAGDQRKAAVKMQKEHLKFSGSAENVFKINKKGDKYDIDVMAVEDSFKSFKPKDYDEVGAENINMLIAAYSKGDDSKAKEIEALIAKNMSISALKKLASNGEKEELTRRLGEIMEANGRKDELEADKNISAIMGY